MTRGSRALARPEPALFALLFGAYAFFYQAGGFNQNSRFDLVRAVVEQGTVRIDALHENAGDKAYHAGHYYSDKAPGSSLLGLPAYALADHFNHGAPPSEEFLNDAAYWTTLTSIALPSALGALALCSLAGLLGMSLGARVVLTLATGLGTLAFPYSTLLYGHQLCAALLIGAFWLLARVRHRASPRPERDLFFAGLLLGLAFMTEYTAALAIAVLGLYALSFLRSWARLGWLSLGAAIPLLALALYHTDAFGGPLAFPYSYSTQVHRHLGVVLGMSMPAPMVLGRLLFGPYRGLFYSAPWLIAAAPGAAMFWASRHRAEGLVSLAIVASLVCLNATLIDWEGGWTFGARYLIPAIPFLALLALGRAPSGRSAASLIFWTLAGTLIAISMAMMLVATSVQPQMDLRLAEPFPELWRHFFDGELSRSTHSIDRFGALPPGDRRFAWNLGEKLGLAGLASLVPLGVYLLATGTWLWWTVRRSLRQEAASAIAPSSASTKSRALSAPAS